MAQNKLNEAGATELAILMIDKYSDSLDIVNESLLLLMSLLIGGNLSTQMNVLNIIQSVK